MSYIGSKPANKPVVASDLDPTVITGQTALAVAPADTDEFLISDAGVLKRLDASLIGGDPFRTLISTSTISTSTASLSITGMDSTYSRYFITMTDLNSTHDNVTLQLQFIIGGSTKTDAYYAYGNTGRSSSVALAGNEAATATSFKMNHITQGFAAGEAFMGEITMYNFSGTAGYKTATWTTILQGEGGETCVNSGGGTYMNGVAAATGVHFTYSVGNIASGVWKLWGSNE